ncbi:MAG: succinate dehydrogenase cytochrome b subunit [Verrucomicrobia bacterium]|nr:succinate dehydrogenase cytochrome b subunit [Verrucomicrobiota bacterium]
MNLFSLIFGSSLGKKFVMAISGALLFGFVVAHMLGNLQVFLGPEQLNAYGHFLQTTPEILWPARLGLLAMVVLHIWSAIRLSRENKAARPIAYAVQKTVKASYASRTMLMSGLIIAAFVVYHLLHFTVLMQAVNLTGQNFSALLDVKGRHDVYRMMVIGFSHPAVALFYLIAVGLLCLHLSHGVSSLFQSLGLKNKFYGACLDRFAKFASLILFLGYAAIPSAILLGLVK